MANSSLFQTRQGNAENNLKRWEDWSMSINYVVDQFNDVVGNLLDRLALAENTIEALQMKLNSIVNASFGLYVKLELDTVLISSSQATTYTKTCGVFSNPSSGERNIIYVYSDKTLEGLFVNNEEVKSEYDGGKYIPFVSMAGSDTGTLVSIKTDNAAKIGGGNINLYYSLESSLEEFPDESNSSTAIMKLRISYSTAVAKQLVTLDKSDLSKAIIKNTVAIDAAQPISKYSAAVGQYSSTKTAAFIAKTKTSSRH